MAALLNKHFISIKVDREERPDVDHLYMTVCQAMIGQGGWPLTVVLTPDKKPFFAGTYFPKKAKYNRYGLMEILPQIAAKWTDETDKLLEAGDRIIEEINKRAGLPQTGAAGEETVHQAYELYAKSYDPQYGGFGSAPKFPTSHNLSFLLRYYIYSGEADALEMVEHTLVSMYRGGLYDHIGKGFARYSTDERWLVPHFEKMLYDNALLAMTYIEACQVTANPLFRKVAEEIFDYVLRDMIDPDGAFYSAEDADSEGEEGKFYVWTPEEIVEVLGKEDGEWFCGLYDISPEGNFEGRSIPNLLFHTPEQYAKLKHMDISELTGRLEKLRQRVFEAREKRVHPHKDDKILTSWNGLMIMALAKGAKAFGNPVYAKAAEKALEFIWNQLRRAEDGRLLARYRDGEAAIPGYIDDYAFLLWGCLELYEVTFDLKLLKRAIQLSDEMIDLFWDASQGGFFFYGHDSEQLLTRMKEIYDGAVPSGNAAAFYNLIRLARITMNERYEHIVEQAQQAFGGAVNRYPSGHSLFLTGLLLKQSPSTEIVIAGKAEDEGVQRMLHEVYQKFLPNSLIVLRSPDAAEALDELIPLSKGKNEVDHQATAYVCTNFACQAPTTDVETLIAQIK